MPLYSGGRISSEIKVAELLESIASVDVVREREVVVFNATSLFYSILAQDNVVQAIESAVESMESQTQLIDELIKSKKAAEIDLLRFESSISAVER